MPSWTFCGIRSGISTGMSSRDFFEISSEIFQDYSWGFPGILLGTSREIPTVVPLGFLQNSGFFFEQLLQGFSLSFFRGFLSRLLSKLSPPGIPVGNSSHDSFSYSFFRIALELL